jgi:hypothetical protein
MNCWDLMTRCLDLLDLFANKYVSTLPTCAGRICSKASFHSNMLIGLLSHSSMFPGAVDNQIKQKTKKMTIQPASSNCLSDQTAWATSNVSWCPQGTALVHVHRARYLVSLLT